MRAFISQIGRKTVDGVSEAGYMFMLAWESLRWLLFGRLRGQSVSLAAVCAEAMEIGVKAIPIVFMLCFAVGVMLAIQGIETLKVFGAEGKVVIGIALSVTREFSPLIVAILVAGRSGSAIAARIATMHESQEIDALQVIGINPVRYLAAPLLLAAALTIPALTILGDFAGLLGGGVFTNLKLHIGLDVFFARSAQVLAVDDISQGLLKSLVFSLIIVLVGVANGFQVRGGAEGVGRVTTRSVVMSIILIILADLLFTYFMNR